jgi:hypothetical protein
MPTVNDASLAQRAGVTVGGMVDDPDIAVVLAAYPRASWESWAELKSDPRAVRQGERIVVVHHVSGRTLDGVERDNTVVDVFTLENGLVTHMQAYADPEEAISA